MLVDAHAHLDFPDYDQDREEVISNLRQEGFIYLLNVGSSFKGSRHSIELAATYDFIYASVGIHPHHVAEMSEENWSALAELSRSDKVVAIGETGLDYYRDISPRRSQQEGFRRQINLARLLDLPLIVHNRDADDDTLAILRDERTEEVGGIIHCFSGNEKFARSCLELGFYISVAGQITYPNAGSLREAVQKLPVDSMLVETDAPFLSPQPVRGKRNNPSYVKYTAAALAQLHGITLADVMRISKVNMERIFSIGNQPHAGEIVYQIRDSLYLNITNRCSNDCVFCVRNYTDYVKGYNLRLKREPEAAEIIHAIGNPNDYREIVFCGYGEPLIRLDVVKEVARWLKGKEALVRVNTNGQANLIHNRNIVPELVDLVDAVSVSINVDSEEKYYTLCHSRFGSGTYQKVKEFIRECGRLLPSVSVTFIALPSVDISACEKMAREELGVNYRVRRYNDVG